MTLVAWCLLMSMICAANVANHIGEVRASVFNFIQTNDWIRIYWKTILLYFIYLCCQIWKELCRKERQNLTPTCECPFKGGLSKKKIKSNKVKKKIFFFILLHYIHKKILDAYSNWSPFRTFKHIDVPERCHFKCLWIWY